MFRLVLVCALVALAYGSAPSARSITPRLDGRIVGGKDTTIEEHPYQVSFQIQGQHNCGGSLIAPNIVVTAAHCSEELETYFPNVTVRAGSTVHNAGGQVIAVQSTHEHPKYSQWHSFDYDASVLVLNDSFVLGSGVQLIGLQPVGQEVLVGTSAVVTGWGALSLGGLWSLVLQAVEVPKIADSTCAKNYPKETISSRQHCFGYPEGGKDACSGDSGGPLVVDGKLVGIVSWGYGCAFENYPGIYVKVANPEIQDHINSIVAKYS